MEIQVLLFKYFLYKHHICYFPCLACLVMLWVSLLILFVGKDLLLDYNCWHFKLLLTFYFEGFKMGTHNYERPLIILLYLIMFKSQN